MHALLHTDMASLLKAICAAQTTLHACSWFELQRKPPDIIHTMLCICEYHSECMHEQIAKMCLEAHGAAQVQEQQQSELAAKAAAEAAEEEARQQEQVDIQQELGIEVDEGESDEDSDHDTQSHEGQVSATQSAASHDHRSRSVSEAAIARQQQEERQLSKKVRLPSGCTTSCELAQYWCTPAWGLVRTLCLVCVPDVMFVVTDVNVGVVTSIS